jgi:hypothetical protein
LQPGDRLFDLNQELVLLLVHIEGMNRRIDRRMALLIDAAIHAAAVHGPVGAARELASQGIPLEVAIRVLTRPAERRIYHWVKGIDHDDKSQD